jgi:dihydrofolate reductase
VIWGSLSIAQTLMRERLIDEYQLLVCPVVLPGGVPLFRDKANAQELTLLAVKSFDRGTVLLAYKPARTPRKLRVVP